MKVESLAIPEVKLVTPRIFRGMNERAWSFSIINGFKPEWARGCGFSGRSASSVL